jgi:hypothetical protein
VRCPGLGILGLLGIEELLRLVECRLIGAGESLNIVKHIAQLRRS